MRNARAKGSLKLAVEGLRGQVLGEGDETFRGEGGETFHEAGGGEADGEEELTATGKETIYQGILWMKEKYEQYREEADRRYEQLREEHGRSERRYQELLTTMEQDKISAFGTVTNNRIEELEAQLRSERLKVEELVLKLQANSQLLLTIYQELDKSFHLGDRIPDLGK